MIHTKGFCALRQKQIILLTASPASLEQLTPSFNGGERISREYYDDWMSGNSNPAIGEHVCTALRASR